MEGTREAALAGASADAGIGRSGSVDEGVKATGTYHAVCLGPKAECRDDYFPLYEQFKAWQEAGNLIEAARLYGKLEPMLEQKWEDDVVNTVTTAGKNDMLDKYFAGSSYTAAFYIGLIADDSYTATAAGDTMSSHSGWTEEVAYSNSTRVSASWSSASSGSKALSSAAQFNMNANGTVVKGCFAVTNSTKSGTTGVLYSAGVFSGGDKTLDNGDILNVSYTATQT